MSPAKIAMAVAVTIEASAGTGSMKKVSGTSRAVAMVAVSPGTAPTNRPNSADIAMTPSTSGRNRSEEHTSELQSLMRISYAVFCLKKKTQPTYQLIHHTLQMTTARKRPTQTYLNISN